nr:sin3 histone deacetylase corepressor complex component SDS3 isoform X2 [Vanessa tameamea]
MQLLRVTSTMSYQGSPYSGPGDEYDFEDDGYDDLDEYRDPEDSLPQLPMDDSDEDTEEASETDIPNNDEPLEIKEQMYQDKLVNLKKQLQQLEENIHPEFLRRVKRLEHQLHERLRLNRIYKDHMYEVVEREYIAEQKAAAKEFEEKKIELRENLLNDFEEKRKLIESERHSMELNGDSIEVKPPMKRILRRRANEPAPAPEKRRKPLATTLTFQLDERDIDADLRAICRASPPPRHPPAHLAQPRKHLNSSSCERRRGGHGRRGGRGGRGRRGRGGRARGGRQAAVRAALVPPRAERVRGGPGPAALPRAHPRHHRRRDMGEENELRASEDIRISTNTR